ncbi:MAG: hypothetical protein Q7U51_04595 [Methanoregula sp.]|nr:hypothetical protein [Methanoregula sp.]
MDYLRILTGKETNLPIYTSIIECLENPLVFPDLIEPIYQEAMKMNDEDLDRFRFSLIRLQIYSDIHRNEDLERAMHIKYVAQVLEKVVYGTLIMEREDPSAE